MASVEHSDIPLTRAQRRRIEHLADVVDRTLEGDRRFFERHTGRNYRIRRASRAEIETMETAGGLTTRPGLAWFACIKQLAPGTRCRLYVQNAPNVDTDMNEETACHVYEYLAQQYGEKVRQTEEQIRSIIKQGKP